MLDERRTLQPQFRNADWTFLLDGRVVEWFYNGTSTGVRVHVDHLRMDGAADGDGIEVRFGVDVNGTIVNGGRMKIPAPMIPAFNDFVALAIANRTPP